VDDLLELLLALYGVRKSSKIFETAPELLEFVQERCQEFVRIQEASAGKVL
jgi:hypothetical protein